MSEDSVLPRLRGCIGDVGMGLRDEKKDLDVLAALGLRYVESRDE